MNEKLKKGLVRNVILVSALFLGILFVLLLLVNFYFKDYFLQRYIKKSQEVARHISRSFQNIKLYDKKEKIIQKIIHLNFPDEENIVNIVVRDKLGKTMYTEHGEKGSVPFTEILSNDDSIEEKSLNDTPMEEQIKVVSVKKKDKEVIYYKISSPIYRNGEKVGSVFVGISKDILVNRLEISKTQMSRIVFMISSLLFVVISISFLVNMRFFVKLKRSQVHADSLKRLAYVGELSSGLAHEIRNPLNAMSINIQMLMDDACKESDDRMIRRLERLKKANTHAARVLNNFLDFARHKQHQYVEFDLVKLLHDVREILAAEINKKEAVLEYDLPRESIILNGDPNEFRQIFLNLFLNSLDAVEKTHEKRIRTIISIHKNDLHVYVSDTGLGMDKFTCEHIFTPFFTKKKHGSGLGLSVVKRIVEEYDGEILCRSSQYDQEQRNDESINENNNESINESNDETSWESETNDTQNGTVIEFMMKKVLVR